jgi:hypothetical protein
LAAPPTARRASPAWRRAGAGRQRIAQRTAQLPLGVGLRLGRPCIRTSCARTEHWGGPATSGRRGHARARRLHTKVRQSDCPGNRNCSDALTRDETRVVVERGRGREGGAKVCMQDVCAGGRVSSSPSLAWASSPSLSPRLQLACTARPNPPKRSSCLLERSGVAAST